MQNKVCYTAIFGDYEDLKEPTIISKGWRYVCFTNQPLKSNVWQIVQVQPTMDNRRMARHVKINFHQYVLEEFSMWIDASFRINIDLNIWWDKTFKSPFSCPKHPLRTCVYQEIKSCLMNRRGEAELLRLQEIAYKAEGVPTFGGIITSGLLMRQRLPGVIELCQKWWAELQQHSSRDQVAFAKVSQRYLIHTFVWDYSMSREIRYYKHYHLRK